MGVYDCDVYFIGFGFLGLLILSFIYFILEFQILVCEFLLLDYISLFLFYFCVFEV